MQCIEHYYSRNFIDFLFKRFVVKYDAQEECRYSLVALSEGERKVRTGVKPGMGRKLRTR